MKILSIDVGIKNLAYCLLENNDNKWKIIKMTLCQTCLCKIRVPGETEGHTLTFRKNSEPG